MLAPAHISGDAMLWWWNGVFLAMWLSSAPNAQLSSLPKFLVVLLNMIYAFILGAFYIQCLYLFAF